MIIRFVTPDGDTHTVEAASGQSIMAAALAHNVPGIEAECGGCCTCCTCHAYIDADWQAKLPTVSEDENTLLEFAWQRNATSRLTCQIPMTDSLSGITVTIPAEQA